MEEETRRSTREEYFESLRMWVQHVQICQSITTCTPYYLLSCTVGGTPGSSGDVAAPLNNNYWQAGRRAAPAAPAVPAPPPPDLGPLVLADNASSVEAIARHGGLEYVVAPLYKRLAAELVDFILLFVLKLAVTYVAVDYFQFIQYAAEGWDCHIATIGESANYAPSVNRLCRQLSTKPPLRPVHSSKLPLLTELGIYKTSLRSRRTFAAPPWDAQDAPRYVRNATITRDLRATTSMFKRVDVQNFFLLLPRATSSWKTNHQSRPAVRKTCSNKEPRDLPAVAGSARHHGQEVNCQKPFPPQRSLYKVLLDF